MKSVPLLGVIADDYTGATDLAGMIARTGMRVVQYLGIPSEADAVVDSADCIVIALKSRSTPAHTAVAESTAAARWLRKQGVEQLYFKYCSTFDSTDRGNIGPVADALAEVVGASSVVFCPATPEHGRTTYQGHLFVGDVLLSSSPLRDHPLNPMRESDLRIVLAAQTETSVTGVSLETVLQGAREVRDFLGSSAQRTFFIADVVSDDDIDIWAEALHDAPLVTGGAALGAALAARRGRGDRRSETVDVPVGPALVLAGSCSAATRAQLAAHRVSHPVFEIDVYALDRGDDVIESAFSFLSEHRDDVPAVIASADPDKVAEIHRALGVERSAVLVEEALGGIAQRAAEAGFRRILVAGGETSGAVVNSLGVRALRIGAEVAPGVPWTVTESGERLGLLLKSGNFGSQTIFEDALRIAGEIQ